MNVPSLKRAAATDTEKMASSLPYGLLVARMAETFIRNKTALTRGKAAPEAQATLQHFMTEWLATTGPGSSAKVERQPNPEAPNKMIAFVTVRTGRGVLGGVDLMFGSAIELE